VAWFEEAHMPDALRGFRVDVSLGIIPLKWQNRAHPALKMV
jgi:hypothetical protein